MTERQWEDTVSAGLWRWVDRGDGAPLPPDLWPRLEAAVRRGRLQRRRRWLMRAGAAAAVAAGSGAAVLALARWAPDGGGPVAEAPGGARPVPADPADGGGARPAPADPADGGGARPVTVIPADGGGARPVTVVTVVPADGGGAGAPDRPPGAADAARAYYPTAGDPGLAWALEHGMVRGVGAAAAAGPYTITVDSYLADFNRTAFLVTLTGPGVRQLRMDGRDEARDVWTLAVDGRPVPVRSDWDNAPIDENVLRARVDGPPLSAELHQAVLGVTLPGAAAPDPWTVSFDLYPPGLSGLRAREIRPQAELRQEGVVVQVERLLLGPTGTRLFFTVTAADARRVSGELRGDVSGIIFPNETACAAGAGAIRCDWRSTTPVDPADESLTLELTHLTLEGSLSVPLPAVGGAVEHEGTTLTVVPSPESGLTAVRVAPGGRWSLARCRPYIVDDAGRRRDSQGVEVQRGVPAYRFDLRDLTPPLALACDGQVRFTAGPWVLEIPLR